MADDIECQADFERLFGNMVCLDKDEFGRYKNVDVRWDYRFFAAGWRVNRERQVAA